MVLFETFCSRWKFTNGGAEINQKLNSRAGLGVGDAVFGDVRFEGTFFVDDEHDNDVVGVLFGYQDNKNFYVVTSTKHGSRQVKMSFFLLWCSPRNHHNCVPCSGLLGPPKNQVNNRSPFQPTPGKNNSSQHNLTLPFVQASIFQFGRTVPSVPGQATVLWQHGSIGWKVTGPGVREYHLYPPSKRLPTDG